MATNYPTSLDTTTELPDSTGVGSDLDDFPHSALHGNANDAIRAIQTELGAAPKGSYTNVKERLDELTDAWTNATYETGWTVPDGSRQRLQYKKTGNIVHVYGGGKRTGSSGNSVVATLPVGFRPPADFRFAVFNSTNATNGVDRVEIGSDGAVLCYSVNTNEEVSFAVSFAAA